MERTFLAFFNNFETCLKWCTVWPSALVALPCFGRHCTGTGCNKSSLCGGTPVASVQVGDSFVQLLMAHNVGSSDSLATTSIWNYPLQFTKHIWNLLARCSPASIAWFQKAAALGLLPWVPNIVSKLFLNFKSSLGVLHVLFGVLIRLSTVDWK